MKQIANRNSMPHMFKQNSPDMNLEGKKLSLASQSIKKPTESKETPEIEIKIDDN